MPADAVTRNDATRASTRRGSRSISYEIVDGGPIRLVLLAGTGLPGAYWTLAQTAAFRQWATCLLVDNAGTGHSDPLADSQWTAAEMALDVVAVMDAIGWDTAHIAGHSLGSTIALGLGIAHRGRVSSRALHSTWSATSSAPHLRAWLEARQATAAVSEPGLWMRYAFFLVSPDHFAEHGFGGGALGSVAELVAAMGSGAHVGQYAAGLSHEAGAQLAGLDIPTLVTVGDADFVTLPRYGRAVADVIPGARFVEFPAAGHLAALEQPKLFNESQYAFIQSLVSETSL
jgi:aminoacrylate hydrolase